MSINKSQTNKKDIFNAQVKLLDIKDWEELIVVINEEQAILHWITASDKIAIVHNWQEIVVNADISKHLVKNGQIGVFKDVYEKYNISQSDIVWVYFTRSSNLSVEAIKKKLLWKMLNEEEIFSIVKDMNDNKLTDTLITYFAATWFFYKSVESELARFTKAAAQTGTMFKFPWKVAVKYCVWWVPWNETTMIVTPIIASLGIKFPKTFTKAITSPAATWECVNVLMKTDFTKDEIQNLVKKNWCCLALWSNLNLAPANGKIIEVAYPISMESYSKMVCGIMAQNYAMWVNHMFIDVPVWPTAKITDMTTAKRIKKHFIFIWKYLWMKVDVLFTKAQQPVGNWVWAVLQVREVLRVLQRKSNRPSDLEKKAVMLAGKVIELVWLAKGKDALNLAKKQLESWVAREKMKKIIQSQKKNNLLNGKNNLFPLNNSLSADQIDSEKLPLAKFNKNIDSDFSWTIDSIDMKYLNTIARWLGCPQDYQAWVYLEKKLNDKVKKWDTLFTIYCNQQSKLDMAVKMLKEKNIYTIV